MKSNKMNKKIIKPVFNTIEEFLKTFSLEELSSKIIEKRKKYFMVNSSLNEISEKIPIDYFYAGTFLGHVKKNIFYPSIALIDLIPESYENTLVLDSKLEWLFLCGRDIFKESLETKSPKGYIVIKNNKNEILGLGFSKQNLILNILDRGDFLRRESTKKKIKK